MQPGVLVGELEIDVDTDDDIPDPEVVVADEVELALVMFEDVLDGAPAEVFPAVVAGAVVTPLITVAPEAIVVRVITTLITSGAAACACVGVIAARPTARHEPSRTSVPLSRRCGLMRLIQLLDAQRSTEHAAGSVHIGI